MRKRLIKKIAACTMALTMAFGMVAVTGTGASTDVQAASKKVKSIKFKKKGYVLSKKGKKVSLSKQLVFNPKKPKSKKVSYKSSSKKIATVSSKGVVTAKKKGTVTITATSKSNKKAKATTKVTVGKTVSKLKFKEGTKKTLKTTSRFTLHPTYSPKSASTKSVTYKSSNTRIATVTSKGVVTAKAAGTATITATCKDAKAKTAKFTVTVPAFVTGVSVSPSNSSMVMGDTATFTAATVGSASGVTYKWSTSNANVASISGSGKAISVTAKAAGTATIKVEAYNGNNTSTNHKTATATVSVSASKVINAAGTYTVNGSDAVISSQTTGTVNIDNSNVKTLTLQPGNYTVDLNNTKVEKIESTVATATGKARAAAINVPTVNLKGNTAVTGVVLNAPAVIKAAETVAPIKTFSVNTVEEVSVEAPVASLSVDKTDAKVTVASPVTTLTVNKKAAVAVEAKVENVEAKNEVALTTTDKGSVESLAVNTKEQVTVAVPTTAMAVNDTAKVIVKNEVKTLNANSVATVNVEKGAKIDTVKVEVKGETAGTVAINTVDGATVGTVEVAEDNKAKADVAGEGTVTTVTVPEAQKDAVDVTTPDTSKVIDKGNGETETEKTPGFKDATITTSGTLTVYSGILTDSDKYKITYGNNTTFVTKAQLEKALGYLANPKAAYDEWVARDTFTDYSGVVSVSGTGETKTVTVKGTTNRDGVYTVKIEKIDDKNYKITVTDTKGAHEINVVVADNGDVTAASGNYTATMNAAGTDFELVDAKKAMVMSVKKENNSYTFSVLTEKLDANLKIAYLEKAQNN